MVLDWLSKIATYNLCAVTVAVDLAHTFRMSTCGPAICYPETVISIVKVNINNMFLRVELNFLFSHGAAVGCKVAKQIYRVY